MMKNILIFGHSRAGKTSLAKRLQNEFTLNIVNEDNLVMAFERAFPQLKIDSSKNYQQTAINITPFIVYYLCDLAEHSNFKAGSKFVADLTFFDFDTGIPLMKNALCNIHDLKIQDQFTFINLDSTKTVEELFTDIRKHDTPDDWTYSLTDDELRHHCAENTGIDYEFYEKWHELNFLRYDVAQGRESIFNKIVNDLS